MMKKFKKMLASILSVTMLAGLMTGFTVAASSTSGLTVDETTKSIYANGQDLLLESAEDGTAIYVEGTLVVDEVIGGDDNGSNGYDLSAYTIYAGSQKVVDSTTASITMTGGEVAAIYAGGTAILTSDVEAELALIIEAMYASIDGELEAFDAATIALLEALLGDVEDLIDAFEAQLNVVEGDAQAIAQAAAEFALAVEAKLLPYILESGEQYINDSVAILLTELENELTAFAKDLETEAYATLEAIAYGSVLLAVSTLLEVEFDDYDEFETFVADAQVVIGLLDEIQAAVDVYEDAQDLVNGETDLSTIPIAKEYITSGVVAAVAGYTLVFSSSSFDSDGFYQAVSADGFDYDNEFNQAYVAEFYSGSYKSIGTSYTTEAALKLIYNTIVAAQTVEYTGKVASNAATALANLTAVIDENAAPIYNVLNTLGISSFITLNEDGTYSYDITQIGTLVTDVQNALSGVTSWLTVVQGIYEPVQSLVNGEITTDEFIAALEKINLTDEQKAVLEQLVTLLLEYIGKKTSEFAEYALDGFESSVTTAFQNFKDEVETPEEYVERLMTELIEKVFAEEIEAIFEALGIMVEDLDPAIYAEMLKTAIDTASERILDYLNTTPEATAEAIFDIIVEAIMEAAMELSSVKAGFIKVSEIEVTGGHVGTIYGSGAGAGLYVEEVNISVHSGTFGTIVDTEYEFRGADLTAEQLGITNKYLTCFVLGMLQPVKKDINTVNVEIVRSLVTTDGEITVYKSDDLASLESKVFEEVVNVADSIPKGLTVEDVTIEYLVGNEWKALDYSPAKKETAFVDTNIATVRVTLNEDESVMKEVQVTVHKYEVSLVLNENAEIQYQNNVEDLKNAILANIDYTNSVFPTSWYQEDGTVVIVPEDISIKYETKFLWSTYFKDLEVLNVQEASYVVTLQYTADDEFIGTVVENDITIIKGTTTVSVDSTAIVYGQEIPEMVTTTPEGVEYIALYTGVTTVGNLVVYVDLSNAYNSIIVDTILKFVNIDGITFSGLSEILSGPIVSASLSFFGVDTSDMIKALDMLAITEDYVNVTISFGQPVDAGAYVVTAVTTSNNYNTAYSMGGLAISPAYVPGALSFNDPTLDVLDIETFEADEYDLGYTSTIVGGKYIATYTGLTYTGKVVFAASEITEPGVYYQAVAGASGNEFTDPIGRSLTLERYDVDLYMPETVFIYDGEPHGEVKVTNEDGTVELDSKKLVVTYKGINGTVYGPSNEMPTNAGDYEVVAVYLGSCTYATAKETFVMTIEKAEVTVEVSSYVKTYGEVDPEFEFAVYGADELDELFTVQRQLGESVGVYELTVTYDAEKLNNYTVTVNNGSLTILEKETTEPETPDPEQPETPDPEQPETPDPEQPETPDPEKPEAPDPEQPETPDPEQPETPDSEEPETPDSEEPETPDSEGDADDNIVATGDNNNITFNIIAMIVSMLGFAVIALNKRKNI